ncbi:hypothetical protein NDU88_007405 [Pleurodeles waltl]|uniref:Uncharacterized protein n=1 Tax=Pleurodeles waltl TaxID=8319 RepID=A0AAV7N592_PLEWA|nr:hypothetical protein NDU88_007405 [Pleurodeles waltl]
MSEAKDDHNTLAIAQKQVDKLLHTLQVKAEYLEACCRRNNIRIVGVGELTRIDNMERYVEQLVSDLSGCETFSDAFVVEQAHRSLAAPPVALLCSIKARRLNCRDRDAALWRARNKDYNMLYPERLRVMDGGKTLISTDPQKLQQCITKKEAKGQQLIAQAAGDVEEEMDTVE